MSVYKMAAFILAAVLFLLAAFPVPSRVNLGWLGLFFLTLALGPT